MSEKLLKVRAQVKKRKPTFKRVQSHQFSKLKDTKWRKPKGMGNKVRRNRRGKPSSPSSGYGSPKAVKGLNREGLLEVVISRVSDLKSIEKGQVAVISSTVGARNKLEILKEAKKSNISIANVKDLDVSIKALTKEKKKKEDKKPAAKAAEKKDEKKSEVKANDKKAEAKKKPEAKKMNLRKQKNLASRALGISKKRIKFNLTNENKKDVKELISREGVKDLVADKVISVSSKKGNSRTRANYILSQKKKGRRAGHGNRKGTANARFKDKDKWMIKIRALRSYLKKMKDSGRVDTKTYREMYMKSKGNFFRNKRHLILFMEQNNLLKEAPKEPKVAVKKGGKKE